MQGARDLELVLVERCDRLRGQEVSGSTPITTATGKSAPPASAIAKKCAV